MILGLDYLGGAAYGDIILANHPQGWAAGFFDDEFGDCLKVATALAKTGKCPLIRIQLIWHANHQYGDGDIQAITAKAKKWESFKSQFQNIRVQLSPFCEHTLSDASRYLDLCLLNAPHCEVVNSRIQVGGRSNKYRNEFHGCEIKPISSTTPINFSFDGTACVDADVTTYKNNYKNSEVFFFWDAPFNLHTEVGQSDRNWKPSRELIESIVYLAKDKGKDVLPAKWLWKSHSEQKGTGDPRADKPVLICPLKPNHIFLKTRDGHLLETMNYYGPYVDGRQRYYGTQWGYQIAQHAVQLQGDHICDVWADNKKIGTVSPAFRNSEFRS